MSGFEESDPLPVRRFAGFAQGLGLDEATVAGIVAGVEADAVASGRVPSVDERAAEVRRRMLAAANDNQA